MKWNIRMTRRRFGKAALSGAVGAAALARGGSAAAAPPTGRQNGWRWCSKCQSLFYGEHISSACPAGGRHVNAGSYDYDLRHYGFGSGEAPRVQPGWRWCSKCQSLFYGENTASVCPSGGSHVNANSYNYALDFGGDGTAAPPGAQGGWRWCSKCQGLFYGGLGEPTGGVCPSGGPHVNANSYNYFLFFL